MTLQGQDLMQVYSGKSGTISFKSDAPLEIIGAEGNQLTGVFDPAARSVAFSIRINSFHGFNSAVQREHFMENYMESSQFPVATFSGKIIESLDFHFPGTYQVRVKGKLKIHGIEAERIIQGTVVVEQHQVTIDTRFQVMLVEHNISIPKLLIQKIAESIDVEVMISMQNGG
jgi:hypothetical protein